MYISVGNSSHQTNANDRWYVFWLTFLDWNVCDISLCCVLARSCVLYYKSSIHPSLSKIYWIYKKFLMRIYRSLDGSKLQWSKCMAVHQWNNDVWLPYIMIKCAETAITINSFRMFLFITNQIDTYYIYIYSRLQKHGTRLLLEQVTLNVIYECVSFWPAGLSFIINQCCYIICYVSFHTAIQ